MGDKDVLVLIKKFAEDEKDMVLFIIYWILGYWAVGKTIYANKIIFGSLHNITLQRMGLGFFLGWILIPIAILKAIFFDWYNLIKNLYWSTGTARFNAGSNATAGLKIAAYAIAKSKWEF